MINATKYDDLDEVIYTLAAKLRRDGEKVQIKRTNMDNQIMELRQVSFQILDPAKTLHNIKAMKPLLTFTFADIIDQLCVINPGLGEMFIPGYDWGKYKHKNGALNYTYGERFHYHGNQIENIIQRLKNDPNSRQALISIWNPMIDAQPGAWNVPCTVLHNILIRNGKLELTVYYRSLDLFGGFQHDMFFSGFFAQLYARALNVEVGPLTIFANSLHVYDYDYDRLMALRINHDIKLGHTKYLYEQYNPQRLDGTYEEIMHDVKALATKIRKQWSGYEKPELKTRYFAKWAEFFEVYFCGKFRATDSDYKLYMELIGQMKTEYEVFLPCK